MFWYYFFVKAMLMMSYLILLYGLMKDYKNIMYMFLMSELLMAFTVCIMASLSNLYLASSGFVICVEMIALAAIKAAIGLSIIVCWVKYWGTLNCFS